MVESPIVLAVTRYGGHNGYLQGFWPASLNLLDRAVPEFASAVFEHLEELSAAASPSRASQGSGEILKARDGTQSLRKLD